MTVDFPPPLPPTSAQVWPAAIWKDRPRSTWGRAHRESLRPNRTRLVPPPYQPGASRPFPRTNRTRLVPPDVPRGQEGKQPPTEPSAAKPPPAEPDAVDAGDLGVRSPPLPPPSRTNWTRLVPPSVLTGHVSVDAGDLGVRALRVGKVHVLEAEVAAAGRKRLALQPPRAAGSDAGGPVGHGRTHRSSGGGRPRGSARGRASGEEWSSSETRSMREKTSDMACLALPRLGAKADACAACPISTG